MIAVLKPGVSGEQSAKLIEWFEEQGVKVHVSNGEFQTVLGLIGDTSRIDAELVESLDIIESVKRISEPYKKANRKFHPEDTIVEAGGVKFGGGHFAIIAGPCSVETPEQITYVAKRVKESGAAMLRGGAFKPRTSPYDFQGLHEKGIELLLEAKRQTGLPIVTEIMNAEHLPLFEEVDLIQVGARNMQNFELLKALGNENVILCERGIRSFDPATRNVLDLASVPLLHEMTHLPIVVDPSHATGIARLVEPMSLAAVAGGADGLIIEVHNDPQHAWSDGAQSLTPEQFDVVSKKVRKIQAALA